jgi:hypothetical protein
MQKFDRVSVDGGEVASGAEDRPAATSQVAGGDRPRRPRDGDAARPAGAAFDRFPALLDDELRFAAELHAAPLRAFAALPVRRGFVSRAAITTKMIRTICCNADVRQTNL